VLTQQQYKPDLSLWRAGQEDPHYVSLESFSDTHRLSSKKQPHVLLFILESFSAELSAEFSSGKGLMGGKSEMPFLDYLAQSSLSFSRTYAAGDRTDKGLAAILAGYPGQVWQSLLNEPERFNRYRGLAKGFAEKQYGTSFWYGGDGDFSNTSAFARAMGYRLIRDEKNINASYTRDKWGLSDEDVLLELEHYLDSQHSHPQFLTWLSLSSHEPYRVAEQDPDYQFQWSEMQRYRAAIRYTDHALKDFWKRNAQKDWFKESIIVIIADHGRDIETGYTYVGQEAFFHIPWLITGPALEEEWRAKKISTICSQTDVGNTLLSGLRSQSSMLPYSRNALSKEHPNCAAWHTERRLGWIDSTGFIDCQIEVAPKSNGHRLQALENQLWQAMEEGKL
jgi:phosphoglycerol transferase MdoB-like AlkP superfamily enzyme